MPIVTYTKANPTINPISSPPYSPQQYSAPTPPPTATHRPLRSKFRRLLPGVLITIGSLLIANVAWPLLHYQFFLSPKLARASLVTPININQTAFANPSDAHTPPISPLTDQVLSKDLDYTNPNLWFPGSSSTTQQPPKVSYYTLSIPSVNVFDATVEIGGTDLSQHLIHYSGTALPGQLGSPVVFGHSILRQFYNPAVTNPKRYMSIFSKIMTLKTGDDIFVDYDGVVYRYQVKEKFEIKPEDIFILQQRYNNRELKLITCVPEGTYLRRGVVVAQLADFGTPPSPSPTP